jgi:hypothetical protein
VIKINLTAALILRVDTGSGMKNGKLKRKNFFHVKEDPLADYL